MKSFSFRLPSLLLLFLFSFIFLALSPIQVSALSPEETEIQERIEKCLSEYNYYNCFFSALNSIHQPSLCIFFSKDKYYNYYKRNNNIDYTELDQLDTLEDMCYRMTVSPFNYQECEKLPTKEHQEKCYRSVFYGMTYYIEPYSPYAKDYRSFPAEICDDIRAKIKIKVRNPEKELYECKKHSKISFNYFWIKYFLSAASLFFYFLIPYLIIIFRRKKKLSLQKKWLILSLFLFLPLIANSLILPLFLYKIKKYLLYILFPTIPGSPLAAIPYILGLSSPNNLSFALIVMYILTSILGYYLIKQYYYVKKTKKYHIIDIITIIWLLFFLIQFFFRSIYYSPFL